jgi:Spy/CpxP family protein refolding chaperone
VLANDFEAFRLATEGTPLYDLVVTEEDFALFKQAHDLKAEGKFSEAKTIMDELGVSPMHKGGKKGWAKGFASRHLDLTDEQRDALRVAHQANDKETVRAILTEAGLDEDKIEKMLTRHGWR